MVIICLLLVISVTMLVWFAYRTIDDMRKSGSAEERGTRRRKFSKLLASPLDPALKGAMFGFSYVAFAFASSLLLLGGFGSGTERLLLSAFSAWLIVFPPWLLWLFWDVSPL